jgi:hypothetical protein
MTTQIAKDNGARASDELERYFTYRWEPKHALLSREARFNKRWYQSLQLVGGLSAVAVATLIGFSEVPKAIPAALSALVAAINVAERVFQFGDHWRSSRRASETLRRERALLLGHAGIYRDLGNATSLFIEACEQALRQVEPVTTQPAGTGVDQQGQLADQTAQGPSRPSV